MRYCLFALFILVSCSVPDKASLRVMRETRKLRKSPVILSADKTGEITYDKLELRENNSFTYRSQFLGKKKLLFYAGTFVKVGDTLFLNFHNNHKDDLWTGKAVIDKANNEITLISKDSSLDKQMIITKLK